MIERTTAMLTRIKALLLAAVIGGLCLEIGEGLSIPGVQSFISTAQAIVGRPLTPMSVSGVARRTARRCAAGMYSCCTDSPRKPFGVWVNGNADAPPSILRPALSS